MNKKENQCKYSKNDLVYAKIRGYPWWPGIIGEIKMKPGENGEKKYELLVNFIGDHSHSMVNEDKLQKFYVKEIDFKNKKRKKLMQSIQIANDIYNGKYTYEEWRNRDKKRSQQQKKSKQNKDKKSQFNESNSEDGNSSDDQRDSEIEDDEEYGPVLTARQSFNSQVAGTPVAALSNAGINNNQISQQSKQPKTMKKPSGKLSSSANGHQYHEIDDEDAPSKGSSKLKNKRKNNKVIEDSEEEKYKGLFGHHISNSDANHGSGIALNQNGINSANVKGMNSAVRNSNSTLQSTAIFQNDPSANSSTSSSSHQQQLNSNSSSNFNNSNTNGVKNYTQNSVSANSAQSKNLKNDTMVIETDDDEEEEGGAIPNNNLMNSKSSLGNSTEKQSKTSNIPLSKLDETLAKYPPLLMNQTAQSSEEKNKALQNSKQENIQQKNQGLSLKKQQSLEQKQNNNASIDFTRSIRSKQSSLVSNQQQVIEEEDDNSEIVQDSSNNDQQVEIKIEDYEDDSKIISNKSRLNNESSQIKEIQSDDLDDIDQDSENNSNQRQTRASKRKQIKKSKNSALITKIDKMSLSKKLSTPQPQQDTENLATIKNGRLTRSRAQNLKGKKNKNKIISSSQNSSKQHTFLRTRSTVKGKESKITTKNISDDFPSVRTRKGSMRSQQNNSTYYSEISISHSSPHISNNLSQPFIYHDQILNLEDEFNQLFSHLQSMSSLDFSDTFSILQDIIYKIKTQEPKIDNIIGILGSDNGKLLLCAKTLLFNDSLYGTSNTTFSTQQINELQQELDSLIDTLKGLLFKRFFDFEEKLRLLKTVNSSSSKNREFEEFEKASQKISPKGKKKEFDNLTQQMSSSSSSCSVRPRKQSSSQQIKDFTPSQTQQFSLLSKDSSEIMIPASSLAEKETVQEQSLASLIQMQSEASLKMSQTPMSDLQQSVATQKIQNSIDQAIISNSAGSNSTNGAFLLNSSHSYSLGATESFDQKISRQQNSEQNYNDKIIDEQSENKCDKENNINNLTEDQKLMRRKICLKIIKPLIKILKDQPSAQNYAKNIEIMIRQKYPQMCGEYKNICKNLITLINQIDFHTTSEKIELYLSSHNPENISILEVKIQNYNGESAINNDNLKNPTHLNDESNFSQHANRTPNSCRKYSNTSMRMEEEENMNRYDNSSESGGHHDVHNQSQSGEDKSAVFEEFASKNLSSEKKQQQKQIQQIDQQNKIIVDEEDDEEEVQVEVHQKISLSVNNSPHNSQIEESKKDSLLNPVEQNQMILDNHGKLEIKEEKMEEEEVENSCLQKEERDDKVEEKQEDTELDLKIKINENSTPIKSNKENEDNIQVEDDDDEEEEEIGSQYSQQLKKSQEQILNSSRKQSNESRNESCKLSEQLQCSPCDKYLQLDALESHFDHDTSSNKPCSIEKTQIQHIENEHKSVINDEHQKDIITASNEIDAEHNEKVNVSNINNEVNESSSTPLLCDNNQNPAAPSLQ
ncbi:PWWP domain protein (macronuclear) [Tetrahymena thermophila SB210]|uniref:PWWP domain protein n=1 Tax=Tetrahymena thermophila (strain SB210) TaxID=312017 RepID=I7MIM7_TETTS|nr:PWWP domain protein [Tetrahymena thermophila SB210]EAS04587.2 PWWP domain protein [Tetrahymena thermophila SB210]|eukprot:XP_001024832.2 PWWP domain protein [Tetrahymena thermophila SB210]